MTAKHETGFSLSLLVVDDDKMARDVLNVMITRKFPDFPIYFAENGRTGVDLFRKHSPQIIITDISMPVMDGIQMAGEIRAINNEAKFIVLTGYSDRDYSDKLIEFGIHDCIMKPIVFGKLFAAIEKCMKELDIDGNNLPAA